MRLSKRLRKWKANLTTQTPVEYVITLREDVNSFADEVRSLERENAKLRELVRDLLMLPSVPAFDCFGCKYERHHDCDGGFMCRLVERGKRLGIEVLDD